MQVESYFPVAHTSVLADDNLWAHQRERAAEKWAEAGWAHLWEPRTGKTRLTHKQMLKWFEMGWNRILISAPQTVCDDIWIKETREAFPWIEGRPSVRIIKMYAGTIAFRKSMMDKENYLANTSKVPTVIVVNRDALAPLKDKFICWGPHVFVLDELHDYKTPSSLRGRAAYEIAKYTKIKRGLTGTIITRNYADVYGQAKIINPEIFGTNKAEFERRYLVIDPTRHNKVIGYRNVSDLKEKMARFSDIKLRSECFSIPQEVVVNKKLDLPPNVKRIYRDLVKDHVLEQNGKSLSFDHALSRLTALQQIAGGSLKHKDGTVEWLHNTLLDAAEEETVEILESGNKHIIFYRFSAEGGKLHERLSKYGAILLNGDTKPQDRSALIKSFQDPTSDSRVLVVQESIGAVGLSFAVTNYITFFSTSASYGIHKQAKDRIFAPDTTGELKLNYTYLQARGTVHTWVANLIRTKQNASDVLLSNADFEYAAMGGEQDG